MVSIEESTLSKFLLRLCVDVLPLLQWQYTLRLQRDWSHGPNDILEPRVILLRASSSLVRLDLKSYRRPSGHFNANGLGELECHMYCLVTSCHVTCR